jgi:hypothetical protein
MLKFNSAMAKAGSKYGQLFLDRITPTPQTDATASRSVAGLSAWQTCERDLSFISKDSF